MHKCGYLTLNAAMAAMLLASPLLSQSDPNRPSDTASAQRSDDHRDDRFNMGWLGLLGLAGLVGLKRKSAETLTDKANARVYP